MSYFLPQPQPSQPSFGPLPGNHRAPSTFALASLESVGFVNPGLFQSQLMLPTKDRLIAPGAVQIQWHVDEPAPDNPDPLFALLIEVPGVVGVGIVPYLIAISKAEAYSWDEIIDSVVDAVKTHKLTTEFIEEERNRNGG